MATPIEEFNDMLSKLNDPEISAEDRTEVLTTVRSTYGGLFEEHNTTVQERDKLSNNVTDLTKANARLFNETGFNFGKEKDEVEQEEEKEEFSETITLEEMESKYRQY